MHKRVNQAVQIGNPNEAFNLIYGLGGILLSLTGAYIGVNRGTHIAENEFQDEVKPTQNAIQATRTFLSIPGASAATPAVYNEFASIMIHPTKIPTPS